MFAYGYRSISLLKRQFRKQSENFVGISIDNICRRSDRGGTADRKGQRKKRINK
ncbi:hypothetical protein COPCOM_01174 [Coprococcus comes ATCC 27758]|uniref:Uncharacterized protein n=1 Tax=Coprococcus comes ATCC 27758 TaxID=470146 RepID=C0B7Q1_9FIRM|nr:hypothetical protein COPCOM_01174 [Coprococcus comes ATCC 27758]